MAEEQVEAPVVTPKSEKKRTQYSKTGNLVMDAIENLKERKGSTIMKIRNYISTKNPELDMTRYATIIKKFILSAVEKGDLKTSDTEKGVRGHFSIVEKKKPAKKSSKKEKSDEKPSVLKEKTSKNASSPKVKKPVKKTVKMPSAVAPSTVTKKKKTKPQAKASPVEAKKESSTKKKATKGPKSGKIVDNETPEPKKLLKRSRKLKSRKLRQNQRRLRMLRLRLRKLMVLSQRRL
ncbi:histone H1-like [Chironomus tepperi]|uniref:histone H1-like n=1 Tax=Chironomus tepperi TaxID=113505 RepID=UPI00391EF2C6